MAEKKKILICSHWMEIGGAERALLGLLYSLDYSKYDVDLYLCRHTGEFMKLIPSGVHLIPEDKHAASIAVPAKQVLTNGDLKILLGRTIGKFCSKVYQRRHKCGINNIAVEYSGRFTYPFVSPIMPETVYDLVISFLEPHYICAHRVRAKKKIAWMHTDYGSIGVDVRAGYKVWSKYDAIVAISQDCRNSFEQKFPGLSNRLILIENINHVELIKKQSMEFDVSEELSSRVKIISIGRFCSAKNFDNIPDICARLIQAGLDVKWYIIGYGGDEPLIRQRIADAYMEDHVILLGKKENPYPYIKACDLYVQPSRYEGKCVTVREAQILGKPVVITRYATSSSQLENGVDGVIVPMDNEGCAEGIAALLREPEKMRQLSETCRNRDYSNASEVEKIYQLMED